MHYIDTDERCMCGCHPRLPDTDLHDFGFDCLCTHPPAARRRAFKDWRARWLSTGARARVLGSARTLRVRVRINRRGRG